MFTTNQETCAVGHPRCNTTDEELVVVSRVVGGEQGGGWCVVSRGVGGEQGGGWCVVSRGVGGGWWVVSRGVGGGW